MVKNTATIGGILLILAGLVGFAAPSLMGMHLSTAHNIVHLVSGAIALYFGLKATPASARAFCIVFGAAYGLLGLIGFAAGGPGYTLTLIPGELVLGTMDHVVHVLLGAIFLIAGLFRKVAPVMSPHP
jgi:hypothetical protein